MIFRKYRKMAYKTLDIYRKMAYPIRYDIGFCDIAYITLQSLPVIAITRIRYHRSRVRIKRERAYIKPLVITGNKGLSYYQKSKNER